MRKLNAALSRRITLGKLRLPVWLMVGLVSISAFVFAGQAVGPVMTGSITGSGALLAEQAIIMTNAVWRDYPPTALYSISPRSDDLRTVDSADIVRTTGSVDITLTGETVEGGTGLDFHPTNGLLYGLLKLTGQAGRELVTIDPSTGAATSIGDTGDRFAALAFHDNGTLYAVTGDGAGVPETLYTLDITNASSTFVATLGNGNDGEALAFNSEDNLLYHASGEGIPNVNEVFETISPATLAVSSITLLGQDYSEATALTYEGDGNFFLADLGRRLFRINTDGVIEFVGIIDHDSKGLAPFGLADVDDAIAVINDEGTSFTGAVETHVGDSVMLVITLDNLSDDDAYAMLNLEVPSNIDVEIEDVGSVSAAQHSNLTWLLEIPSTLTEGKINIVLESEDNHPLGFDEITATLVQIEG